VAIRALVGGVRVVRGRGERVAVVVRAAGGHRGVRGGHRALRTAPSSAAHLLAPLRAAPLRRGPHPVSLHRRPIHTLVVAHPTIPLWVWKIPLQTLLGQFTKTIFQQI
jgi:hypothetical protein